MFNTKTNISRFARYFLISGAFLAFGSVHAAVSTNNPVLPTPITIDGVKYVKYALLSNTASPNSRDSHIYTSLQAAVDSGYSTIIVGSGTFYVRDTVRITKSNILLTGMSKETSKIIQANPEKDLLQVYANKVTVKNLTLDTKTNNAYAAFVIGDGSRVETTNETLSGNSNTLTKCNILGGNKGFTLYVAGPTYSGSIFTKYTAGKLSDGNTITNNYMEGKYVRDAFVFALQKNGKVQNNTFSGGELDVYMNQGISISTNTFTNSVKAGIFISGPSKSLSITNNTITNAREHGIKSYYQIDNTPIATQYRYIDSVTITGNSIVNSGENGMDLNYFTNGSVTGNSIQNSGVHGISLVNGSSNTTVSGNKIVGFGLGNRFRGSGVFITVGSKSNKITGNSIVNTNATLTQYAGVFLETSDSTSNEVSTNVISGSFTTAGVASYDKNVVLNGNSITNNLKDGLVTRFY